jgi:hypothetical protein
MDMSVKPHDDGASLTFPLGYAYGRVNGTPTWSFHLG